MSDYRDRHGARPQPARKPHPRNLWEFLSQFNKPPPIEDTDDAHGTLGFVLLMLMAVLIGGIMVVRSL